MAKTSKSHVHVPELTPAQKRTLKAIGTYLARESFPPTMEELGEILDLRPATVHQHVTALVRKGYLRREPRKARGLVVLRHAKTKVERLVSIPLLGDVKAGPPMLAEENVLGEILVDAHIASRGRCFALRTKGDSMKNAGMHDGDVVIVRQQPVAENGDIVVASLDGEATLKRLYIRGDEIELRPENQRFKPIVVSPETELQILGKVLAVRGNADK